MLRGYANKLAKLYQTSGVRHGSWGLAARVETKIFVFAFSRNSFSYFRKNLLAKYGKTERKLIVDWYIKVAWSACRYPV